MRFDQRNLRETQPHRDLLAQLDLKGRTVVDLGVGHSEILDLVLEREPARVIECDESARCDRAEVLPRELGSLDLLPENCVVLSNPPSDSVEHVLEVLEVSRVRDVVLMVAEEHAEKLLARGFEIVFRLEADAFDPPVASAYVVGVRWASWSRARLSGTRCAVGRISGDGSQDRAP